MTRSALVTRTATPADVPALVDLWRELRQVGGRAERATNPVAVDDIGERLTATIGQPRSRVVVALVGDEPAGMAVLRVIRPDPLSDSRVVQIAHLVVGRGHRRRGVGHALIAAAAEYADERGLEHVAAAVYPSLRDASRFYARLGFAPVVLQRVAPVPIVRRRLGNDGVAARIDDVVRRRTRIRRPLPAQRATVRVPERVD